MPEWISSVPYLLLVMLGFSLVVFFHELGHYLAAKWAGVRVERFAIGFGRELFGFTWGETRYSFNLLPLGGYVKMLGQEDFAVDKSGEMKVRYEPGSFMSKSVGKRMVIVSAGVVMNLIFAVVAFGTVMMLGDYQMPAVAGQLLPGSAAARAGLQTGDRILAVNGEKTRTFEDLLYRVALSEQNEELELTVERDGRIVSPNPRVLPEYRAEAGVRQIGLGNPMNLRVAATRTMLSGQAAEGELQPNDYIEKIGSGADATPVRSVGDVSKALIAARGRPVELTVKRPTGTIPTERLVGGETDLPGKEVVVRAAALWILQPTDATDQGSYSLLGLAPRPTVLSVARRSPAELAGLRLGDTIVAVGTLDDPTAAEIGRVIEANPDRDVRIVVRRPMTGPPGAPTAAIAFLTRRREELLEAAIENYETATAKLTELAKADAGLAAGDHAWLATQAGACADVMEYRAWLEGFDRIETYVRPQAPFRLLGPAGKATIGITSLYPVEWDRAVAGAVVETVMGRLSPARQAGIPRGAAIVRVDGKLTPDWATLTEALREASGKSVRLRYRLGTSLQDVTFAVPESISSALALAPESEIIEIAGATAADVPAVGRAGTRRAALPDWQAVEKLLRANIGKSVPVKVRQRETGTVSEQNFAVTADNVDPWLLRVGYEAPFSCYPRFEMVRERNPLRALVAGVRKAHATTMQTYLTIKHIVFTREVGVENVSGPLGIIRRGSQVAEAGFKELLMFLGLISANLAVINFLPMPIVDGGLFIFLLLEKIRGEPVSIRTQVVTQLIGIALILTLFLFVTFQDIANWHR